MKLSYPVYIAALISFCFFAACSSKTVPVGLQKQLLVDDYLIAQKNNITRELGKPVKLGVVMKPTLPTDFNPDGAYTDGVIKKSGYDEFGRRLSVVWNDKKQIFQMLYRASGEGLTGYAESSDGINWIKPLISGDGTSNLITYRGKNRGTFYEASFMIDPTVPWGHPEKYKAAFNPGNVRCAIAHSKDGIHWIGYNEGKSVTGRAADTFNQILWDPINNRYMLLTRTDLGDEGGLKESRATRIMVHKIDNDLNAHPMAWETVAIVNVDEPGGATNRAGVPRLQMESMNIWVYENVYFGLMHVLTVGELTGSEGRVAVTDPDKRPESDVIDYYIGTSRNGQDFDRSWIYARKPFIQRGPDGSFDKAMLQPSSQIITLGDEHYIYYTGQYSQHHSPEAAKKESGKIGLAKLPLDRFIGQCAGQKVGSLTTRAFVLEGDQLEVNIDAGKGWFKIELLDENGQGIKGFSGKSAKRYKGLDELHFKPQWVSSEDMSRLKGKLTKLRFTLQNARLFAFQVKKNR